MKMKNIYTSLLALLLVTGCSTTSAYESTDTKQTNPVVAEESYDEANAININLENLESQYNGVSVKDNVISITSAGTYVFTGEHEGSINVNATNGNVQIVLKGVNLTSDLGPAINVEEAKQVTITCQEGTSNTLTSLGVSEDTEEAVINSQDNLVINGNGELYIEGEKAIKGNDDVYISNAIITVKTNDDSIKANDLLVIDGTILTINSQVDGLKSGKSDGTTDGKLQITESRLVIVAEDDGIDTVGDITIEDSDISVTAGGGAGEITVSNQFNGNGFGQGKMPMDENFQGQAPQDNMMPQAGFGPRGERNGQMMQGPNGTMPQDGNMPEMPQNSNQTQTTTSTETSSHGITSTSNINITNSTLKIDALTDGVNADGDITIDGKEVEIKCSDDGLHSETTLTINSGLININQSDEGLEAMTIIINDGEVNVVASDDGINASNPNYTDSMTDDGSMLEIHGGNVTIDSGADGIDLNGSGLIDGGYVVVNGPTNNGEGALDYNGTFDVNGGTLIASGSSGMALGVSNSSKSKAIVVGVSNGTKTIEVKDGNDVIVTYTSDKNYQHIVIASEELESGKTYSIYQDGTLLGEATLSDTSTYVNANQGGNPFMH